MNITTDDKTNKEIQKQSSLEKGMKSTYTAFVLGNYDIKQTEKAILVALADLKAKIKEWAKKTFTPENMEDKFGITITIYECKSLLKEFEELK